MIQFAKKITRSMAFRTVVITVIVLTGVLAGLETSPSITAEHAATLAALNLIVTGIFLAEIALKLIACGRRPQEFFRDGWNVFDFVIVALCLLPLAGPFAAVLRLVRVLRLLRLVSALPKLQLLVVALLKSLSAMGYVSLLLALLFYIYAVAGVHLFGRVDGGDFATLPAALFSLFRVVTLDNWGDIFNRALEHTSPLKVTLYFVTFIVFGTMIILNLFIGIIMNSMTEAHTELEQAESPGRDLASGEAAALARLETATQQLKALQIVLADLRDELQANRQPATLLCNSR